MKNILNLIINFERLSLELFSYNHKRSIFFDSVAQLARADDL